MLLVKGEVEVTFTDNPGKWDWEWVEVEDGFVLNREKVPADLHINQYAVMEDDEEDIDDALDTEEPRLHELVSNHTACVTVGDYIIEHRLSEDDMEKPLFRKSGDKRYLLKYTSDMLEDGLSEYLEDSKAFNKVVKEIIQSECPGTYEGENLDFRASHLLARALCGEEVQYHVTEILPENQTIQGSWKYDINRAMEDDHYEDEGYFRTKLSADDYELLKKGGLKNAAVVHAEYSWDESSDDLQDSDGKWNLEEIIPLLDDALNIEDYFYKFTFIGAKR